jgi:nitroreductase
VIAPTVDEALRGRRSTRSYVQRGVPDALLRELLDLARHAPSSMGGQPCCFVVVRDEDARRQLAAAKNAYSPAAKRARYPADFLAGAPAVVAVCVERDRAHGRARENGILAAGYLLLAAHGRGLSGVYLSAYQNDDAGLEEAIRDILQLPPEVEPVALVPIGFPAAAPAPKEMRPLTELVHHEIFGRRAR